MTHQLPVPAQAVLTALLEVSQSSGEAGREERRDFIDTVAEVMEFDPNWGGSRAYHELKDGLYIRSWVAPAGVEVVGREHALGGLALIGKGRCLVLDDDGLRDLRAPVMFQTQPGSQRYIYVVEDLVYTTIHAVPLPDGEADRAAAYVLGEME